MRKSDLGDRQPLDQKVAFPKSWRKDVVERPLKINLQGVRTCLATDSDPTEKERLARKRCARNACWVDVGRRVWNE